MPSLHWTRFAYSVRPARRSAEADLSSGLAGIWVSMEMRSQHLCLMLLQQGEVWRTVRGWGWLARYCLRGRLLPHKRVGDGELESPVHQQRKEASSIASVVKPTVGTTLPCQTSQLNCILQVAPNTPIDFLERDLQVDPPDQILCILESRPG